MSFTELSHVVNPSTSHTKLAKLQKHMSVIKCSIYNAVDTRKTETNTFWKLNTGFIYVKDFLFKGWFYVAFPITLFFIAYSVGCLLSSKVRLCGKANLIFEGNFLTERATALYSTISTATVSVLLLSGGQGWLLHFKWKPWWNSNVKYRQIWTTDQALWDTHFF